MILSGARRGRFPFPSFLSFLVAALLAPLPPPGSLRLAICGARLAGAELSATLDWSFPSPLLPPSLVSSPSELAGQGPAVRTCRACGLLGAAVGRPRALLPGSAALPSPSSASRAVYSFIWHFSWRVCAPNLRAWFYFSRFRRFRWQVPVLPSVALRAVRRHFQSRKVRFFSAPHPHACPPFPSSCSPLCVMEFRAFLLSLVPCTGL